MLDILSMKNKSLMFLNVSFKSEPSWGMYMYMIGIAKDTTVDICLCHFSLLFCVSWNLKHVQVLDLFWRQYRRNKACFQMQASHRSLICFTPSKNNFTVILPFFRSKKLEKPHGEQKQTSKPHTRLCRWVKFCYYLWRRRQRKSWLLHSSFMSVYNSDPGVVISWFGVFSVTLWLCGGNNDYLEQNVEHFKIRDSVIWLSSNSFFEVWHSLFCLSLAREFVFETNWSTIWEEIGLKEMLLPFPCHFPECWVSCL